MKTLPLRRSVAALGLIAVLATAGCSATGSNTSSNTNVPDDKVTGNLTVMRNPQDIDDKTVAAFNKQFPHVKITLVDQDATKLKTLQAAGTPPDIFRTQGPSVSQLVSQNQILDLSSYFASSKLLPTKDLASANDLYVVKGKRYGVVKDWSPDYTVFINNALFKQAGVPIPDASKPLSWKELAALAAQVTNKTGDRTNNIGIVGAHLDFPLARTLSTILAEKGEKLYSDDEKSIKLTSNPDAMDALKFFVDLAKNDSTWSPVNPDPSWGGDDFTKNQAAIAVYGMWFAGFMSTVTDSKVGQDFTILPAPYWSDPAKRLDPTITATGYVVSSKTKSALAAWKFLEWYGGGDPATARAKQGWGVPAKTSDLQKLPAETAPQKQVNAVLATDVALAKPLQFNRYYDDGQFQTSFNKNLELYLKGSLSFSDLAGNVEKDVNAAIAEGVDQAG